MVIITQVSYPPTSMQEVAKRFLQAPPLPAFLKRSGPYVNSDNGLGIQIMAVYDCEPQHLGEGLNALATYMSGFFDVPGFTYSNKVWQNIGDALKAFGLGR
ncbi:MAG: hypothetical protein HY794_14850 [Desulfarculus sp.]|nr:hypothetical protein [Desulfarculus sp.]